MVYQLPNTTVSNRIAMAAKMAVLIQRLGLTIMVTGLFMSISLGLECLKQHYLLRLKS
jgi:hypothetical protein